MIESGVIIRRRFVDAMILALKVEVEAMSQGMHTALQRWKMLLGNGFYHRASRRNAALLTS